MRITLVALFYPPSFGGAQSAAEYCAKALAAEHEVTVVCSNHEKGALTEVRDGVTVVRCTRQAMFARQPISLGMAKAIRDSRPDLIHFHAPNFWAAALIELLFPRVPVVVFHHMDTQGRKLLKTMLLPIYRILARRAQIVIVSDQRNRAVSTDLPRELRRVAVIPFPVEPGLFQRSETRIAELLAERRATYGDTVVAGFLGRLVWYKGLEVLLEAMRSVEGVHVLIAGDGQLREKLEAMAVELGVQGKITFLGAISDEERADFLATIDFLIFPSTDPTETFGIAQAEAQYSGKPVIATRLATGAAGVIVDGESGLLVEPSDAAALSGAIDTLAGDAGLRARMGVAARINARRFTPEQHDAAMRAALPGGPIDPVKVLFVTHTTEFVGGAEHCLLVLIASPLVEPELAVPGPGALATAAAEYGPVHPLPIGSIDRVRRPVRLFSAIGAAASVIGAAWALRKLSRQRRVDVIHAHGLKAHWIAVTARLMGGAPVVLGVHDIPHRGSERLLWGLVGRLAQGVAVVSRPCWPGAQLPRHVRVLHNGVPPVATADRGVREGDTIVLGFLGRIHPWKGLERLFAWMRAGIDAGHDLRLLVRGTIDRTVPGYDEVLQAEIARLGLGDRVVFEGFVSGEARFAGIDMLCLPSTMPDPLPLVVLEAQSRGVLVAASPGGGVGDMITDGQSGFIIADPADFVRLLGLDAAERDTVAQRGQDQCRTDFSLDGMRAAYADFYRDVAGMGKWQGRSDSNRGPSVLETDALTS